MEKLCKFMAGLVGEGAVSRPFLQREERLRNSAARCGRHAQRA